ncbi:hypothetical protein AWN70_00310 [Escherichia coli]|nr:hypothetical protein AWN70_00310 [Escherichia coli]
MTHSSCDGVWPAYPTNTRSLVFDLGGGTFDVTVLEYATPVIEVHASAGDNFLGGEDFTHMLVDEVLKRADVARTTLNESELAALYACVEAAKCSNQSPLHIRWQYQEETRECEFYENELEDLWLPLLNRLRVPIEQALRDARLKPSQIDSLVLVGGASQMPLVQRIAVRLFGNYRIKVTIRAPLSRWAQQSRPPAAYAVKILKR